MAARKYNTAVYREKQQSITVDLSRDSSGKDATSKSRNHEISTFSRANLNGKWFVNR
jgi:hypothetical protein